MLAAPVTPMQMNYFDGRFTVNFQHVKSKWVTSKLVMPGMTSKGVR